MFWTISLTILFILLFSLAYAALSGAPWVPTWKHDTERIVKLLDLKPGDKFYELGSGIGTLCIAVAQNREVKIVGVELSLAQWLISIWRKIMARSKNIQYRLGNLFHTNLSDADAVYFFLMPDTNKKLKNKLEKELRPGTKVVSYVFPVPSWEPAKIDESAGFPKLFLYIVK